MAKLTNIKRETIISEAVKKRIAESPAPEYDKKKLSYFVGHVLYNHFFTKEERAWLNAAPKGFVLRTDDVFIFYDNDKMTERVKLTESLSFPVNCLYSYNQQIGKLSLNSTKHKDLINGLKEILKERNAFDNMIKELRSELKKIVYGCRTEKQLCEAFPELVKYVGESVITSSPFYPPVVRTDYAKKLLNLQ